MARRLDSFPEDEDAPRGRYPWNKWLNGEVWELQKGTKEQVAEGNADFHVETRSFRSAVQQATRVRKGDVKTAIRNNGDAIVIQFMPKVPDGTPPPPTEAPRVTDDEDKGTHFGEPIG